MVNSKKWLQCGKKLMLLFYISILKSTSNAETLGSYWSKENNISSLNVEFNFILQSSGIKPCLFICNEVPGCNSIAMEVDSGVCYGYTVIYNPKTTVKQALYTRKDRCSGNGYVFSFMHDFCYKLHSEMLNWHDAKEACEQEDGTLVSIETVAKLEFISDITAGVLAWFWVGGSDLLISNSWIWTNDQSMQMSQPFWHKGEPNGQLTSEGCAAFAGTAMVDVKCGLLYSFVCQK